MFIDVQTWLFQFIFIELEIKKQFLKLHRKLEAKDSKCITFTVVTLFILNFSHKCFTS